MNKTIPILCLFLIACIEIVALLQGINGKGLALAIGALFGIAGWFAKGLKINHDEKRKYL